MSFEDDQYQFRQVFQRYAIMIMTPLRKGTPLATVEPRWHGKSEHRHVM
jgi:hypothetical protein